MRKLLVLVSLAVLAFSMMALGQGPGGGGRGGLNAGPDNSPKVGDVAPEFAFGRGGIAGATALKDLQGKKFALIMFFPGAFTPGCTTEFTEAGQNADKFAALNIEIIGISRDLQGSLNKFKEVVGAKNGFVSDPDLTVSNLYGSTQGQGPGMVSKRNYFLVDQTGKVIWKSSTGALIPTERLLADLTPLVKK